MTHSKPSSDTHRRASVEPLEQFCEVAAGLVHAMGGPLTAIEVMLGRLDRDRLQEKPDEVRAEITLLAEQSRRLSALVHTLRLLADPVRPRYRATDVNEAVRAVVRSARSAFDAAQITVQLDLAPETAVARVDPSQLRDVLWALLTNARVALEHWPGDRRIRICTGRGSTGRATVTIHDSGPGIPSGQEERIFLPFVSGWGGEGVGLSFSRLAMLRQGGWIDTRPRPDTGGATFSLELPPPARPEEEPDRG